LTVGADDRGLLLGDGLFETLLWSAGALAAFEAHAARLARGCAALGLPAPDPDRLRAAALDAVTRAGLSATRAAVRLTWTAGEGGRGLDRPADLAPRLLASAAPSVQPAGGARLVTVDIRRNEGSPASRLKTLACLDNVLARRAARLAGADEALMLNNRGEIAGAAAANLFWFEADALVTPALDCGVLDGTVRGAVIERARQARIEVREVRAGRPRLEKASGLFLTNSLIGLRPVEAIDGVTARPHPGLATLLALSFPEVGI
jgi:branched-subunit amino acid aminotransferase/4-amino-4-deoxychorismate lyase